MGLLDLVGLYAIFKSLSDKLPDVLKGVDKSLAKVADTFKNKPAGGNGFFRENVSRFEGLGDKILDDDPNGAPRKEPFWRKKQSGESNSDWIQRMARGPKWQDKRPGESTVKHLFRLAQGPKPTENPSQGLPKGELGDMAARSPFEKGLPGEVAGSPFKPEGEGVAGIAGRLMSGAKTAAVGVGILALGKFAIDAARGLKAFAGQVSEATRGFSQYGPRAALATAQQDLERIHMAWRRASAAEPYSAEVIKSRTDVEKAALPLNQVVDAISGFLTIKFNRLEESLLRIVANTALIKGLNSASDFAKMGQKMAEQMGAESEKTPFQHLLGQLRNAETARPLGPDGSGRSGRPMGAAAAGGDMRKTPIPSKPSTPSGRYDQK